MEVVHGILTHEQQVAEVRRQIAEQARDDMEAQQREHVLRQQKRAIEHALGEGDEGLLAGGAAPFDAAKALYLALLAQGVDGFHLDLEELLDGVLEHLPQLRGGGLSQLARLHGACLRATIFILKGSLWAARARADRAMSSGTPPTS